MICITPFKIKYNRNGVDLWTEVKCGRCTACRITRVTEWTMRVKMQLSGKNISSCFLTLTYDDENLPWIKVGDSMLPTLRKRDVQLFMKKLRKKLASIQKYSELKYIIVGEYGEETQRPHYHAIIVGLNYEELKDTIYKSWEMGSIHSGSVTDASIRYTMSYVFKDSRALDNDVREPEFKLSSNKWGEKWLDENFDNLMKHGFISHNGKNLAIPKYLKDKYEELRSTPLEGRLNNLRKYKEWIKNGNYDLPAIHSEKNRYQKAQQIKKAHQQRQQRQGKVL